MADLNSDFVFLNADIGIEGVFQGIIEGSVSASNDTGDEKVNQIVDGISPSSRALKST